MQPGAVLGTELVRRGHDVTLATTDDLTWMGDALDLRTVPLAFIAGILTQKMLHAEPLQAAVLGACHGADVVVASQLVMDEASCVAEAMKVPFVGLHFSPRRRNAAYAAYWVTTRRLTPSLRRATHHLVTPAEWKATSKYVNTFRRSLGLPATDLPLARRLAAAGALEIQAYGTSLVPALKGWLERFSLVGFLAPAAEHRAKWGDLQPDEYLERCLDGGVRPYSLGSAACRSETLRRCSQR